MKPISKPDVDIAWFLIDPIMERRKNYFNTWFDERIRPLNEMIEKGVDVQGIITDKYTSKPTFIWNDSSIATHKALLINIEPIRHESAIEVLRELVS